MSPSKFADHDPHPDKRPAPFEGVVRRAVPSDADAVARITAEREGLDPGEVVERIRTDLTSEWNGLRGAMFVAQDGCEVVAFARTRLVPPFDDVEEDVRPPAGWYLLGVVVDPAHRRRGIARALTAARLDWLRPRTDVCYYFVRGTNAPSIALHNPFGFEELTRRFRYPRTGLEVGDGILYRATLR